MASVRIAHMSRDEVVERLEKLGWELAANVEYTLLEEKSILHELEEKVTRSELHDNSNVCAGVSQKNKTELREVSEALSIPLSGDETKPPLTRKIKEVQAERAPLRYAILDFGRHRGKTYEWVCAHDKQCRDVGGAGSRGGRCYSVATAKEVRVARGTVTVNVSEGDELTATEVAQPKQRSWTQRRN